MVVYLVCPMHVSDIPTRPDPSRLVHPFLMPRLYHLSSNILDQHQTIHPMSPAEAGKIAERVREDQKKLMEGAPTEWSMAARAIAAAAPPSASQHEDTEAVGASTEGSDGGDGYQNHAGVREEGSAVMPGAASSASSVSVSSDHHDLLFRLLLAEMQGDGPAGGLNNRWIDRDALLQVR